MHLKRFKERAVFDDIYYFVGIAPSLSIWRQFMNKCFSTFLAPFINWKCKRGSQAIILAKILIKFTKQN